MEKNKQQTALDYWNRIIIDSNKLMKKYMEKNKQQTALDFFLMKLVDLEIGKTFYPNQHQDLQNAYKEANQIMEQQIKQAWIDGENNTDSEGNPSENYAISAEHYYNEKYNKQ